MRRLLLLLMLSTGCSAQPQFPKHTAEQLSLEGLDEHSVMAKVGKPDYVSTELATGKQVWRYDARRRLKWHKGWDMLIVYFQNGIAVEVY